MRWKGGRERGRKGGRGRKGEGREMEEREC